jgi:hypothetical protein
MMKLNILLIALVALAGGCKSLVPANSIRINGPSGKYRIDAPKDVDIKGFLASVGTNGVLSIYFDEWKSQNSPAVIDSAAQLETARWNGVNQTITSIGEAAGKMGGAAAKTAVMP